MLVQLPDNLMSDKTFKHDPVQGFRTALPLLNKQLHSSRIDDSMSGTTAIVGLIRSRVLYVANVGDSRAVLAIQGSDGNITAKALSHDQTPFRYETACNIHILAVIVHRQICPSAWPGVYVFMPKGCT